MRNHWKRVSALSAISSACCVFVLSMTAQTANAIGLLEAYQAALKNDPSHKMAKAELIAGKEYEAMGRSSLLPSIQYTYYVGMNKGENYSPNFLGQITRSDQDYSSQSKGVTLRQPVFNLEAYARFKQGVAQMNLSDAQFDVRNSDLFIRLLSAYSDAKYAEDQIGLFTSQRDALAEQRRMNDRLFSKGEGTKTDMLETQARLDVAEAMLIEAQDAQLNARNILSGIIGMEVLQLDGLNENFKPNSTIGDFQEWKEAAEKNNPEITAARYGIEIAEQEIKKARAGHAPRIDINASYNHGVSESFSTRNQDLNMRTLGLQVVIPIYSGGYVNAVSKQAVARLERAKAELEAAQSKVTVDLRKNYNGIISGAMKIEGLQRAVNSATLLVEATAQSVKGGIRINADLLNAQHQLMTAKRDLASARYTYLQNYLKLRIAAGTINVDDMRTVAAYFTAN